jgi:hypothetical protein
MLQCLSTAALAGKDAFSRRNNSLSCGHTAILLGSSDVECKVCSNACCGEESLFLLRKNACSSSSSASLPSLNTCAASEEFRRRWIMDMFSCFLNYDCIVGQGRWNRGPGAAGAVAPQLLTRGAMPPQLFQTFLKRCAWSI